MCTENFGQGEVVLVKFGFEVYPLKGISIQLEVLLFDGNSEIGLQVGSNLCYLVCLMHLIRSRAVTNQKCSENTYFPSCVRNML